MRLIDTRPAPGWLNASLARRPEVTRVTAGRVGVTCSVWEPESAADHEADFLLIHGAAAQRGWWDCVAPMLARHSRVVALDLSGHGDSDRREAYSLDYWAEEVTAVAHELTRGAHPILVGHSMGGLVALTSAWRHSAAFRGIVTLETPLRRFTPDQLAKRQGIAERPLKPHATLGSAVASFATVPAVQDASRDLIEHVASQSYRREDAGWVLKLDPRIYRRVTVVEEFLRPFPPGTVCVRAENGLIDDAMASELRGQLVPGGGRMLEVPAVGHNLILEAPLATAWAINFAADMIEHPVRVTLGDEDA